MSSVAFHRPSTIAEAVKLLAADEGARPLAGGASMVAMMNARLISPTAIVSLRDVGEMRGITVAADGGIRIGAMTRHFETAEETRLSGTLACVRAAAGNIANPPVRNMGTMGGSISLADPAADYPPALVAAGATIEFFVDWYTTALQPAELVTAILLPAPRPGTGSYKKLALVAGDFAIVSIALSAYSVAVGGCGPRPIAADEANRLLSQGNVDAAGELLAKLADPVDDVRATAAYRRLVIPRLLKQTVKEMP
jgi:carbon-monoxide dehydrogenase medium subunit